MSGNTIAVTDSTDPSGSLYDGIVRLYHLSGSIWSQFQTFAKPLGDPDDFGDAVWLSGNGLVVRSRGHVNEIGTGAAP